MSGRHFDPDDLSGRVHALSAVLRPTADPVAVALADTLLTVLGVVVLDPSVPSAARMRELGHLLDQIEAAVFTPAS